MSPDGAIPGGQAPPDPAWDRPSEANRPPA
jgi:hypothetical protein